MTVIEESPMRFSLSALDATQNVRVEKVRRYKVNESYAWRGVHARAVNRCNGMTLGLWNLSSGVPLELEMRAFNDGVAFRFKIEVGIASVAPDELTTFTVPAGSTVWSHDLSGHYEGTYQKRAIEEFHAGEWAAPPVTFKLPGDGGYAAIAEANLFNYSGMALEADGKRGLRIGLGHRQPVSHPFELRYSKKDIERLSHPAARSGQIVTPWRVVMVGKDLNTLVNCDVVQGLCPAPDEKLFPQGIKTEWVKPGRAVWRYLDNVDAPQDPAVNPPTTSPATTRAARRQVTLAEIKQWSDWAGELSFEYNILEGFWRRFSDDELRELVDYSKQRGVGLFVWVGSKELRDADARRRLFDRLHSIGIAGLKVDFFDHEHKEMIDLYHAILRDGAERHLLFDFHGANKPTGEPRTWPNELVREAIRGMEARSLTARAFHETTLPFTRFLAGHAEYTGMLFNQRRGDTTIAHQIAIPIVFTAPLLTYGAHPQNILKSPACDLIKSIPSTWDETIVLPPSEIGEIAVYARRSGERWFLAVLNGPEARTIDVPLSFLRGAEYRAMVVRDGAGADLNVQRNQRFRRDQTITIDLPSGGGYIARFDAGT